MSRNLGDPSYIDNDESPSTFIKSNSQLKNIQKMKNTHLKLFSNIKHDFYCPHCEHCNGLKDEIFEKHKIALQETKNILTKSFEYVLNSNILQGNKFEFFDNKKKESDNDIEVKLFFTFK